MTNDPAEPFASAPVRVTVVGIGADGWAGLGEMARRVIERAPLVVGGHRQQTLLPDIPGQDRRRWPTPMLPSLQALLDEYRGREIVVIASGDPLVSGVGSTLIERLGSANVRVIPAVSSVALARARMGWSAESVDVVTVVGRDARAMLGLVSPGRRLIVLSSDEYTPALVAELLVGAGYGQSRMTVLSDLDGPSESRSSATATDWGDAVAARLNLVCLELRSVVGTLVLTTVPGLPDDAFEHDGQLTKRDLRASALARLAPAPGALLWDVGAGAGSIAIEWARSDPRCAAIAVEQNPDRAARIIRNAATLGVPRINVLTGAAPQVLADLPAPDAVFVGGGTAIPGVVDTCWAALTEGGRLVVHAVTLESESVLTERFSGLGGELVRLSVERAAPLGSYTGWVPGRAVTQWSITKSASETSR